MHVIIGIFLSKTCLNYTQPHTPNAHASRALCDQSHAHWKPPFQNPRSATALGTVNPSESAQASSVKYSPPKHSFSKPKVPVSGARKVWGTMRETSASAVIATLTKLTSMSSEQVQARRKFKPINGNNSRIRWWFVLRGDEDILSILESEWKQVQLQTNWKLEPLLKFSDSDELVDSVIHVEDHSNPNSISESFLDQ